MGFLRDSMVREMKIRNYSDATIKLYTKAVYDLAYFYKISPLLLTEDQIKSFLYSLVDKKASAAKMHIVYSGLKFFYKINDRPHYMDNIARPKRPFKIPAVFSQSEIEDILSCSRTMRYKAVFSLIYSAGLRISEALNIELTDIDFYRKMIHIRNAKGGLDRQVILSEKVAKLINRYISKYNPYSYLFFCLKDKNRKMQKRWLQHIFHEQVTSANISKKVSVHTLRHSFATHLLENNTNLFYIMKLLGHRSVKSTMIYLHMQSLSSLDLKSPLDIFDISLDKVNQANEKQYQLSIA